MSTLTTVPGVPSDFPRDRYGRPQVIPPRGRPDQLVSYTRATTFVDCIEDKFTLQKWQQRMVALGLADRPDLLLGVTAHRDDKSTLDRLCTDAREAAAASAKATTGTALHALTELIDRGQDLPPVPESAARDLEAYREATAELTAVHIETPTVQDRLKVGGTPDRVVEYRGEKYIADLKTGQIRWGTLKIAAQLAVYAHSHLYDPATGERSYHGASTNRGIIIHAPAGEGTCELVWIDLEAGWQAVMVAAKVRQQRTLKYADLTEPFGPPARPSLHQAKWEAARDAEIAEGEASKVRRIIDACDTPDQVRGLWDPSWPDELVEYARARVATIDRHH